MRLPNTNTRFALPIIHPVTGETVSAETLYNSACDAMGHQITDHIADLVFDNLDYSTGHDADLSAIYDWAYSVRAQLGTKQTCG